jgi:NAD(P)H dehydrogenase (quinone)
VGIIVTGASGQFGRRAAELLLERVPARELILVTRNPSKLAEFAARGASVRRGDFDDPASLPAAFAGGERMLLISTDKVGGGRPVQHGRAIDAAVRAGVRHIAYTSFVNADVPGHPAISCGEHRGTEPLVKGSGVDWTILRDNQYSEAMAEFAAPAALATGKWVSCSRDGRVGFVSREDCVAAAAVVMTTPGHAGRTYNLTGPELLSFRDAARLAVELGGRPVEYVEVDEEGRFRSWDAIGVPRHITDDMSKSPVPWPSDEMVSFEVAIRDGYMALLSDDVRHLTGRAPRSLRDVYLQHIDKLRPR